MEPAGRSGILMPAIAKSVPQRMDEIEEIHEAGGMSTAMAELDRVLGGGVIPGSAILIGGDPGIGKSTLLLQALYQIGRQNRTVLYLSGEESPHQIKLRSRRMGMRADGLYILAETDLDQILAHIQKISPACVVIDSIQTVYSPQVASAPGSVSQIRESAARLIYYGKKENIALFLVGHVTKDGSIAGPRVLEHMVDTVLYFEGEAGSPYRILRSVKNRFGSVQEIGVFEMKEGGLCEVINPSEIFLAERPRGASGSVVVCSLEGSRPILVELQALVSPTHFGLPRRMAVGVDANRLLLLLAVLEKRGGLVLGGHDVYLNVAGGLRVGEPAIDLGLILAAASGLTERALDPDLIMFGEVGLSGEVRAVAQAGLRIREAAKLGFKRCLLPAKNLEEFQETAGRKSRNASRMNPRPEPGGLSRAFLPVGEAAGMELIGVRHIEEALEFIRS